MQTNKFRLNNVKIILHRPYSCKDSINSSRVSTPILNGWITVNIKTSSVQGYVFWPLPPPWGGGFLFKLNNREKFEGLHEKRKGKVGEEEKKEE